MLADQSKLEHVLPMGDIDADALLPLIVKVSRSGYVPPGVTVRAQISPNMFTCLVPQHILIALENDKDVQSMSISRPLYGN